MHALATFLSQLVSLAVLLFFFLSGRTETKLRLSSIRVSVPLLCSVVRTGLPSLCRHGAGTLSSACLNIAAGMYGGDALIAAFSIVSKVTAFILALIKGLFQGAQSVYSYNKGAGRDDRIREAYAFTLRVNTLMVLLIFVLIWFLAPFIVGLFSAMDRETFLFGVEALRFHVAGLLFMPYGFSMNILLQAVGESDKSTFLASLPQGIVCLACNVLSFFLGHGTKDTWNNIVNGIQGGNFAGLKQLWKSMMAGAKSAAEIAIPTAACGIIIDVMTEQTSLATNLSGVIAGLGMSNLFFALLIGMIGCMLLGMALPTVAAYLVGVTLFVPTLRSLGIQPLVANMFVFYYGIMAQITPPVCVASYTAAGIAGADAMKTGLRGMMFALVGFLVPFVFVYNPAILLQGTPVEIVIGAAQLLVGTYFLALAVSGYFKRELTWWMRAIFFVVALGFIDPNWVTTLAALAVGVALAGWIILSTKKAKN